MKRLIAWWGRYLNAALASASSVAFYRSARDRRIADAAGHVAVLVAVVWLVPFALMFFLDVRQGLSRFMDGFRAHVPPGTVFEMKDHVLSTTLSEPIVVRGEGMAFILNAASSTLELDADEVGVSVGAEALVQKPSPGRSEVVAYAEVPDFRLTKEDVEEWIARYAKWAVFLASLVALVGLAVTIAVGTAFSAAVHALLLWLLLRALKRHWHYRNAFTVALYASTVPILSGALFALARVDAGIIPTALYWVLLGFVAYDAYRGGISPPSQGADHDQGKEAPGVDRPGEGGRTA